MKIRILHKVFLALLLSAGGALAAMALLVQWNLGRGFLDYVKQVEEARLDEVAAQLAQQYETNGSSWDWVMRDRNWVRLTGGGDGPPPPNLPPPARLPNHAVEPFPDDPPGPPLPAAHPPRLPDSFEREASRHPAGPGERDLRARPERHNVRPPPLARCSKWGQESVCSMPVELAS